MLNYCNISIILIIFFFLKVKCLNFTFGMNYKNKILYKIKTRNCSLNVCPLTPIILLLEVKIIYLINKIC